MSSSPPPSYYHTTTETPATRSEKPSVMSKRPTGSRTYHLTLERCKKSVLHTSGLQGPRDTIEDRDATITICRQRHLGPSSQRDMASVQEGMACHIGQSRTGRLRPCCRYAVHCSGRWRLWSVSMLEFEGDPFWEFHKRDDINVISFGAYCAPRHGEAPGEVRSANSVSQRLKIDQELRGKTKPKKASKSQQRCIVQ